MRMKKAGGGNRTRVISLEGWGFTTKLHPRYLLYRSSIKYENTTGMSTENISFPLKEQTLLKVLRFVKIQSKIQICCKSSEK